MRYRDRILPSPTGPLPEVASAHLADAVRLWSDLAWLRGCMHRGAYGYACARHPRIGLRCEECIRAHLSHPSRGHVEEATCGDCGNPASEFLEDPVVLIFNAGVIPPDDWPAVPFVDAVSIVGLDLCGTCRAAALLSS